MVSPVQDAACVSETPLKGCASPERDHDTPSPASPQGSAAWLVAIAELWKVKWHFQLGIFGLSIKLKMIIENPVNLPGEMG